MNRSRLSIAAAVISLALHAIACAPKTEDVQAGDEQNVTDIERLAPGEFSLSQVGGGGAELGLTLRATSPGKGQAVVKVGPKHDDVRDYDLTFSTRHACGVVFVGKGVDPFYGETETGDTITITDYRSASATCDVSAPLVIEESVKGVKTSWLARALPPPAPPPAPTTTTPATTPTTGPTTPHTTSPAIPTATFSLSKPSAPAPEVSLVLQTTGPTSRQAVLTSLANPKDLRVYLLKQTAQTACDVVYSGKGVDPFYGETETGNTLTLKDHRSASGTCDVAAPIAVEETVKGVTTSWLGR